MKSTEFSLIRKLSSAVVIVLATFSHVHACGPFPPIIPTPNFFTSNWNGLLTKDFYKQENLRLWQKLTSEKIPLDDIEQVVYKDDRSIINDIIWGYDDRSTRTDNLFYIYLQNTKDLELADFLSTAKDLEERRNEINSPWYYPSSRDSSYVTGDFQDIIDKCKGYDGTRIKDRYALQTVRALFASRNYDECVEYFKKAFQKIPDENLFKRMALGYVAGCWYRLGNADAANECFAQSGDFYSIKSSNPVAFMAERNPDNPELLSYNQKVSNDSAKFCAIRPVAESVLRKKKVKSRGDWEFALAYMYGEFYSDSRQASQYIRQALQHPFSSDDLRDHARAYRMKIDAENGNNSLLLSDLKWMESKIDLLSPDAVEWNRMMQNIIYINLVPKLWDKKDYTTAILLCGYADNLLNTKQRHIEVGADYTYTFWERATQTQTLEEMRKSERFWNTHDYGSLSFQLMGSLSSDRLIDVKRGIASGNKLFAHLKKYARYDSDYLNELIGTLALREENYQRAVRYFADVSDEYLQSMNIYKDGYLKRDPFCVYPSRWFNDGEWEWETKTADKLLQDSRRIKYKFAVRMLELYNQMKYGETADIRGMARLKYAIGRRNSFEECWALTQYWRGYVGKFEPMLQYWDGNYDRYDNILYDYSETDEHTKVEELYQAEIKQALAMMQSDESKAEAEYMLGNLRTIVKHYGNTTTAQRIKTSCDNWRSWL